MGKLPMKLKITIKNRDRLFKKFKKSKLQTEKGIYNAASINYRKILLTKNSIS